MIRTALEFTADLNEDQRPAADRLEAVVAMMREMSEQTDPQAMVRAYGARMRQLIPTDGFVALSRRDLQ
jgi:sigma-B regulation protein RsbU (phosphoserine phosphatase)